MDVTPYKKPEYFRNRELSWISFDERVLNEARDKSIPLFERLKFISMSAGCAIGCGNVWKFPWMCGQYGGGGFVLLYFFCLVILGLPIMIMEFCVGRAAQASPIKMYQKLEKKGQKWHIHGYVSFFGSVALMAFYTVVTGWIVYYFVRFLTGNIQDLGFSSMITNPGVNVTRKFFYFLKAETM